LNGFDDVGDVGHERVLFFESFFNLNGGGF
jgi:hypothetical protein